MSLIWSEIMFVPDQKIVEETALAWKWLVPEPWKIIFSSMFGGVFLEKEAGDVHWLECGTGVIEKVANSAAEFHAFLSGPRDDAWASRVDDWFLPPLVQQLHKAGKIAGPDQCYGFTILPIFKGGTYNVENCFVVSAREWFTLAGSIHEQVCDVPDGSQVKMKIVD
ncbi:hypothetical protein AEAC466_15855 [Asticcacaulis sp. AC466]|uniref:T6SS immunity protein Tdi1 domain-containing protein n=1 Tax=Asticcacaulis sp. AC466 TaxID=1282362 RepID=UPI0003C3D929|nr:T6SS immunity protein Tdi1 domain-containing protein [Asticcacaulis sp. AC466]ESQ82979.1 hypothetical protein AEAC466_15855 [Asticcacaulis sp. AC466]